MRYLKHLALGLGLVSAAVNAHVLMLGIRGETTDLSALFWGLYFGVFLCFVPALYRPSCSIKSELPDGSWWLRAHKGGELAWKGTTKWPFYVLWVYVWST